MNTKTENTEDGATVSNSSSTDLLGNYTRLALEKKSGYLELYPKGDGFVAQLNWEIRPHRPNRNATMGCGATIEEALADLEMMAFGILA